MRINRLLSLSVAIAMLAMSVQAQVIPARSTRTDSGSSAGGGTGGTVLTPGRVGQPAAVRPFGASRLTGVSTPRYWVPGHWVRRCTFVPVNFWPFRVRRCTLVWVQGYWA
jgi:hypothetical protein